MRSDELFEQAKAVLPGGVCASTRLNVGLGKPMYVRDANGARFTDVDGREYLDMCCSHGAALLGHAYPPVLAATGKAAAALPVTAAFRKSLRLMFIRLTPGFSSFVFFPND